MIRAGFVVHGGRPQAIEAGRALVARCRERGLETRAMPEADIGADAAVEMDVFPFGLDLVISIGGDGTLLRAARLASGADAPLLGVNVGRVGFLTECDPAEAPELLDAFLAGELLEEQRTSLEAEPEGAGWSGSQWALNEVIVEKHSPPRMVTLAAWVGDDEVTTFSADGVIVATSTGSTAYSFAARGPIVSPALDCLILTPVSPHMVFDRALVLPPDVVVTLEVRGQEPGLLSADGRPALKMPVGARVQIRKADRSARLLRRKRAESFFALLRRKFSLPAGPPGGA